MALTRFERASMLEFAKQHHLFQPTSIDTDNIENHVPSWCELENGKAFTDSEDAHLHCINTAIHTEKLSLSAAAGRFLASVSKSYHHAPDDIFDNNDLHRAKRLKLELPILQTDHELDVCSVASRGREPEIATLDDFEPVPVEEEAEHGVASSSQWLGQSKRIQKKCNSEKLEVGRESLAWLQSVLTDHRDGSQHDELDVEVGQRQSNSRFHQALTPPLSPNPGLRPVESSSPISPFDGLLLLSNSSSASPKAATELANSIFQQDELVPLNKAADAGGREDELADAREFLEIDLTSPPLKIDDLEPLLPDSISGHLKLDEPLLLLPNQHVDHSESEFSENLLQLAEQTAGPHLPETTETQDDLDAIFHEFINTEAAKVQDKLDSEILQEADTTMRLAVPALDFSAATAPWIRGMSADEEKREDQILVSIIERLGLYHISVYEIEKQLDWVPFPMRKAKAVLDEEEAPNEELIESLIDSEALSRPRAELHTFICLPKGLHVFRDLLEDEEIEPGEFNVGAGLARLIRKKKLELDEARRDTFAGQQLGQMKESAGAANSLSHGDVRHNVESEAQKISAASPAQSFFSTSEELHRFMCMQNGQVKEFRKSCQIQNVAQCPTIPSGRNDVNLDPSSSSVTNAHFDDSNSSLSWTAWNEDENKPTLSPQTEILSPRSVIVSSAAMSQYRGLFNQILHQYPSLDLISRDFCESHVYLSQEAPHYPNNEGEADIIISPSTGIILTTLKKIKQKPLPGQKDLPAIRLRISQVCWRYENVIVLVNEDSLGSQNRAGTSYPPRRNEALTNASPQIERYQLSQSDREALESLQEFASSQSDLSTVTVMFGGSTNASLVKCLINLLDTNPDKFKTSSRSLLLFQDETTSELVLRKAGLNAFAAQAILMDMEVFSAASCFENKESSSTKAIDVQRVCSSKPGVRGDGISRTSPQISDCIKNNAQSFLSMSPADRKRRFAKVLEGTRILDRLEAHVER